MDALFFTRKVSDWLATTQHGAVLHIFERACNLVNEHNKVLSIVMPEIGRGPFNLVLDGQIKFTSQIELVAPIFKRHMGGTDAATELHIGNLSIQTGPGKLWDARPDWKTLHANRESILHRVTDLSPYGSPTRHQPTILQFSNSLPSSLALADLSSSLAAAKRFAGLGPGLTPAGDDYMMGALYAVWILHPHTVASRIAREIAAAAAPRTTSLSGAWLRAAGDGEAGVAWHTFLDTLCYGERSAIDLQISNILSIGATSGADALAGFMDTFTATMEIEKKHVFP